MRPLTGFAPGKPRADIVSLAEVLLGITTI
jgi:hypothetical protein